MSEYPIDSPEADSEESFRIFRRKLGLVVLTVVGLVLLWNVRRVLLLLFIAGVLAAGIAPVVRRLRAMVRLYLGRRIHRGTAVLMVYVPFLIAAILFLLLGVPKIVTESQQLATQLPAQIEEKILEPLKPYLPIEQLRKLMTVEPVDGNMVFGYLRGAVTVVTGIVATLFMVFYMLIDAERLRNLFLLFYPPRNRAYMSGVVTRVAKRMSLWLSGQLMLAGIIGLATLVTFTAMGIPYAIPLALIAAVGEMVPVIGPILGAVPALIVALFESSWQFWGVLAAAILIQQVENLVLVPRLMGNRVSTSPLAVFVAFMMGGSLLGFVGAILAIPIAAIAQVVFEEGFVKVRERRRKASRRGSLVKDTQS